jgi:rhodanese-related sulfurtransferase
MKNVKKVCLLGLLSVVALSGAELDLKKSGLKITYVDSYDTKSEYNITRTHSAKCKDVQLSVENVWSGDFANAKVPIECKKTFITTIGKISPMKINDDIKTYGELEVIDFMQKAQTDPNMLLVDARLPVWYEKLTIPTSINLPFPNFDKAKNPAEFDDILETIGVVQKKGVYDFSNAKTLLLYCNGIWCPQSTWAIENLLKIGYPAKKLSWYRGGMYSWTVSNLTTVVPK